MEQITPLGWSGAVGLSPVTLRGRRVRRGGALYLGLYTFQ